MREENIYLCLGDSTNASGVRNLLLGALIMIDNPLNRHSPVIDDIPPPQTSENYY